MAKEKKANKGKARIIAYAAIIGGLAVASISLFTLSQFEKVKYGESNAILSQSRSRLKKSQKVYNSYVEALNDPTVLPEERDELVTNLEIAEANVTYWTEVLSDFEKETNANAIKYFASGIPAYVLSMSTLVSVGLVLMHAEKVKEKEEKEV